MTRLVAVFLIILSSTAPAAGAPMPQGAACDEYGKPDINNDCLGDLVVGAPMWDVDGITDAGAVQVSLSADEQPVSTLVTARSLGFPAVKGAHFGETVLMTDLDGNEASEIVIGAPDETIGGVGGAGAVYVIWNGHLGPSAPSPTRLTAPSTGNDVEPSHFGAALTSWNRGGTGPSPQLAIGAPTATVQGNAEAGKILLWDYDGRQLVNRDAIWQGHGVPGSPERGDHLGAALSSGPPQMDYLAIGVPDEDIRSVKNAGSVAILTATQSLGFSQDSPGVPGKAEPDDHFGSALSGIRVTGFDPGGEFYGAIVASAPNEDLGAIRDAGALSMFFQISDADQMNPLWVPYRYSISARSPGFTGRAERGDRLGATLYGSAVGVPSEDIGAAHNAGSACIIGKITVKGRVPAICFDQNSAGVSGRAESGDHFGQSISSIVHSESGPTTFIGAPGEDVRSLTNLGRLHTFTSASIVDFPLVATQKGAGWGQSLMN